MAKRQDPETAPAPPATDEPTDELDGVPLPPLEDADQVLRNAEISERERERNIRLRKAAIKAKRKPNGQIAWQNRDAAPLWDEVIEYMAACDKSPHAVRISIYQTDPVAAAGMGAILRGHYPGSIAPGGGGELADWIINNIHLPLATGPSRYTIRFQSATGSEHLGTGELSLASPREIVAMRSAQRQQTLISGQQDATAAGLGAAGFGAVGFGAAYPAGLGALPPQQVSAPPPYVPPPAAPAPPPYFPPGTDPSLIEQFVGMRTEFVRMQSTIAQQAETLRLLGVGIGVGAPPPPVAPPPPAAAPVPAAPQDPRVMAIQAAAAAGRFDIVAQLAGVGAGAPPAVAPAAPAPAYAPPAPQAATIKSAIENEVETLMTATMKKVVSDFRDRISGDVPSVNAEPFEPPEPTEPPPFSVVTIPDSKWKYIQDVRSGLPSLQGGIGAYAAANMEPITELGLKVLEGLGRALGPEMQQRAAGFVAQAAAAQQQAQVVGNIPKGAQPAGVPNGAPTQQPPKGWSGA